MVNEEELIGTSGCLTP